MSQEFESRVNELVVARNLPYNEAAEIVTRELAEEGVEETQKKRIQIPSLRVGSSAL